MGSRRVWPNGGNFFRLSKTAEGQAKQIFQKNPAKFIIRSDLPLREATHLHPTGPHESQKRRRVSQGFFLRRRQQFNQFAQATKPQPFYPASLYQTDGPRQAQHPQPDVKRQTWRFDGNCFYSVEPGHEEAECRQEARDIENVTLKQTKRQSANQQERRQPYNRKLVCQICNYTGHWAKYCCQRQQNSTPYGQIPLDRQSAKAN